VSRILLGVSRYDYGRPDWGDSFEYVNFVGPLKRLGHVVRVFDTLDPRRRNDHAVARSDLLAAVREFEPDLLLCVLASDELPIEAIREAGWLTTTANWFPDDAWRFTWFSSRVAPAFHWALTTSRFAERRYAKLGVRAVFLPWACNTEVFHPGSGAKKHDVSFVGQRHGRRGRTVERLKGDGLDVYARGAGWPGGRVGWSEMSDIFSSTRVNLSLIESSAGPLLSRGWRFRGATRADRALLHIFPAPAQMKARIFEVAGCGGFCITGPFDELGECFVPGSEMVVADRYKDLRDSIRHYLGHEVEREAIARAALAKCIEEHTYEQRFTQLFEHIQLGDRK
jgi:spore maturation protein CgeB